MKGHSNFPLRTCSIGVLVAAGTLSSVALADPPGQKPPCVPATNYTLAYDCELFPLPTLAGKVAAGTGASGAAAAGTAASGAAAPDTGASDTAASSSDAAPAATTSSASSSSSSSSSGPSHAPAYVTFALAAAGAGVGATFGVLALKNKSTLDGECNGKNACPPSASSTVSALKTDGILADVGIGVAIVGVTLGTILFATESGSKTTTGTKHVQPWVGLGSAGLSGTF